MSFAHSKGAIMGIFSLNELLPFRFTPYFCTKIFITTKYEVFNKLNKIIFNPPIR